ncbi:MAG: alpha/beta fold hydrolase [Acidimicrobiales bacterium]
MAHVQVGDGAIAYEDTGEGPPMIFSHAGIADRRMWQHQCRDLATDRRVIAYDWRGYGGSSDAHGEVIHHEDLLGLMDALEIPAADLVGCSMGGGYALEVALVAPERVRSLTLVCSGLPGHVWPPEMLEEVKQRVHSSVPADRLRAYQTHEATVVEPEDVAAMAEAQARYMVAGPTRSPAEVDRATWQLALSMLRGVFGRQWTSGVATERQLEPPAAGRLAEVEVPTLIINGLDDVPWIQEVSGLLSEGIPGARRLDIAGSAHLPPLERPAQVTAALRRQALVA